MFEEEDPLLTFANRLLETSETFLLRTKGEPSEWIP